MGKHLRVDEYKSTHKNSEKVQEASVSQPPYLHKKYTHTSEIKLISFEPKLSAVSMRIKCALLPFKK